MPIKRRKRPNWPYRSAGIGLLLTFGLFVLVRTITTAWTDGSRSYGIDWGLSFVAGSLDAIVGTWFVAVGASIGSFLNVVAYRVPLGRFIGGHSSCPFCGTPIDGLDNVPVLAWLKLRGRCRTCRLPISVQYPLVELGVAIAFGIIFLTEFLTNQSNLPFEKASGFGLMHSRIAADQIVRMAIYLYVMGGLIAAALIISKRKSAPLSLSLWTTLPMLLAGILSPGSIVVPWKSPIEGSVNDLRLHAVVTLVCGIAAGITMARLLAPFLYGSFDRKLLSQDSSTNGARQWMGAMGVAGGLLGWQAIVPLTLILAAIALPLRFALSRYYQRAAIGDWGVWIWLAVLIFRANWATLFGLRLLPDSIPTVLQHTVGALLVIPLAAIAGMLSSIQNPSTPQPSEEAPNLDASPNTEQKLTTPDSVNDTNVGIRGLNKE